MSKKAQLSIDIIFGYVAFLIIIYYFSGLIIDIYNPFINNAREENKLKKNFIITNQIQKLGLNNFNESCLLKTEGLQRVKANYEILGQRLDLIDSNSISLIKGVNFIRKTENVLEIVSYSNQTNSNYSLGLVFPKGLISLEDSNLTNSDDYSISTDEYFNNVLHINLTLTQTNDLKIFQIIHNINSPQYYFIDYFNSEDLNYFFENKPGVFSCDFGSYDSNSGSVFFQFFSNLKTSNNDLISLINIESWWSDEI